MSNSYVLIGQFWRLVTTSLVSGQLLGVLMNLLVLWLAGRALESELGSWRFVLLFLASGFGGATLFFLVAPVTAWSVGAASAIVGLLAANTIGKAKTGEDVRPDIGLLVLLVLYAVLVGFASFGWVSLIGGIIVGGVSGAILAYAPRQNRMAIQLVGMLSLVAVCLGSGGGQDRALVSLGPRGPAVVPVAGVALGIGRRWLGVVSGGPGGAWLGGDRGCGRRSTGCGSAAGSGADDVLDPADARHRHRLVRRGPGDRDHDRRAQTTNATTSTPNTISRGRGLRVVARRSGAHASPREKAASRSWLE